MNAKDSSSPKSTIKARLQRLGIWKIALFTCFSVIIALNIVYVARIPLYAGQSFPLPVEGEGSRVITYASLNLPAYFIEIFFIVLSLIALIKSFRLALSWYWMSVSLLTVSATLFVNGYRGMVFLLLACLSFAFAFFTGKRGLALKDWALKYAKGAKTAPASTHFLHS